MSQEDSQFSNEDGDLILPRDWVITQKKTFTGWCNIHLKKVGAAIEDCTEDFRDGSKLALLLEVISNDKLPKLEKGKMKVHYVSNLNKCLNFVIEKGVKLVGIGAEEIHDGNKKMTLGMIWTIILRFAIQDLGEGVSAKDGLLLWCQRRTENYDDVNIQNFTSSWKNGMALNALLHSYNPELVDIDKLDKKNHKKNIEKAMEIAEKHLEIPKILEADDFLMPQPDEKSIMTYVSCYYNAMAKSRELETAAAALSRVIDQLESVEELQNGYENIASGILDWERKTIPELESREIKEDTPEEFDKLMAEFVDFRANEVPKWADEKSKLQACLNNLQTLLRINNKPPYQTPESLRIDTINDEWRNLDVASRNRFEWLKCNLNRHKEFENLRKRFDYKCSIYEQFFDGAKEFPEDEVESDSLPILMALKRKHDAFRSELKSKEKRVPTIDSIHDKLKDLEYPELEECTEKLQGIKKKLADMKEKSGEIDKKLQENIEKAKTLDDLRIDFANKAVDIKTLLDEFFEDAVDKYTAETVEQVEQEQKQFEQSLNNINELDPALEELKAIQDEIDKWTNQPNPYTSNTYAALDSDLKRLKELCEQKTNNLKEDLEKQKQNMELIACLEQLASEIAQWQSQEKDKIMSNDGTLEEQKAKLTQYDGEVTEFYAAKNVAVREVCEKINAARVNADSSLLTGIEVGLKELQDLISSGLLAIESQILIRDSTQLTEKQMSEYAKIFQAIDKHNLGYLSRDDFRNFLIALDYKVSADNEESEKEFQTIYDKCDVDKKNHVTLSNFLSYLADDMGSQDSAERIIESFRIVAEGKPYVTPAQLRRELPNHAEKFIKRMQPYEGEDVPSDALDYASYSASLYGSEEL